ncbi:CARS [Cordylochernes scorpioides]|uniref:Cysteine--tRNA ligase, cytoplasmic n=1 Tax=Cordylochernes scorpioides TaxID=51811 RepID=A0ABY6L5K0_9ARAC|nr:CARS [Cordylochernes scorpioides]
MSSGKPVQNGDAGKLMVYNSLTRQKEEFVPQEGNKVLWYSCGPTVYDASHMGHARSYISFDILRRILKDYFNYDVHYVMNITDIDDKIIKRARQEHLYQEYCQQERVLSQTMEDVRSALQHLESKPAPTDPDKLELVRRTVEKVRLCLANIEGSLERGAVSITCQDSLLEESREVLSDWLDHQRGASVTDNSIFASLPRHWEQEFNKDMDALNQTVSRGVSEYIPQIVAYIQRILDNGMAYESPGGSVYFDTLKFHQSPGHSYAKLVPEARGDTSALEEGEGELTEGKEKRNPMDFALWKASKPGEPSWDSPWGKGRPGWHIECSAMASDVLGSCLDIHTGGIDLKFPHHDNELAQSEAYFNNDCWVRYFLHSGHLKIQGCKMSKSLKNFVTIQEALQTYSADQLRLMFLLHSWKDTLDYSPNTMDMAIKFQKLIRFTPPQSCPQESPELHQSLADCLATTRQQVHQSLCDNMDTRSCLEHLKRLISAANIHLRDQEAARKPPCLQLLMEIQQYISYILQAEDLMMPYLQILVVYRENMRKLALRTRSGEFSPAVCSSREVTQLCVESAKRSRGELLKLCDYLRDELLPQVGVRLEDKEGQGPAIKVVGKEALLREKQERLKTVTRFVVQREEEEQQLKMQKLEEQKKLNEAREAQRKIPPEELFRQDPRYSMFDDKLLLFFFLISTLGEVECICLCHQDWEHYSVAGRLRSKKMAPLT